MSQLVSLSVRQWRKQLGFPYAEINQVKLDLFDLEVELKRLKQLADVLIDEWKLNFPRASVPVYLTKVSDKSLSVLRWRRSKSHHAKAGQVNFDQQMLSYFHVDEHRDLVMKFESLRIDLNLKLSTVLYEIQRLKIYIDETQLLVQVRHDRGEVDE